MLACLSSLPWIGASEVGRAEAFRPGPLRPGFVVVALVVLSGCAACRTGPPHLNPSPRDALARAALLMEQKRWEGARDLLWASVEQFPQDPDVHEALAKALWQLGEREAALAQMEEAVRLSAGQPTKLIGLGRMYLAQAEQPGARASGSPAFYRALACAQAAAARRPDDPEAALLLADVQRVGQNRPEALASYHRAAALGGENPEIWLRMAELYLQADRPGRALASIEGLAQRLRDPEHLPGRAWMLRGIALNRLGRYPEAIAALARAQRAGMPWEQCAVDLAEAYWRSGDVANARLTVDRLLQFQPNHPKALDLAQQLQSLPSRR